MNDKHKTLFVIASCALGLISLLAMCALPAAAQGPIGGALATLAAATAQAQMERQAQEAILAAQRATVQTMMIEQTRAAGQANATATRQAMIVQSTATAVSLEATRSALDELNRQRAATATAQHDAIQATGTAFAQSAQAAATAQAQSALATSEAYRATATSQALSIAAQATDTARLSATYAERQRRFTFGLLLVELGFVVGALLIIGWLTRSLILWAQRMAPRPVTECITIPASVPLRPDVIEQAAPLSATRMPSTVTVVDNPAMVAALDRWAEQYDDATSLRARRKGARDGS